ncbi:hypothetical protein RN001_016325 [Aquatica leii]|uniref:Uncharacterized protein n=1 Tax=Aquatica leii TaxID=1421715 RepID=A0AAN7NZ81_9COLE|nr:hypothetical protein RN001_016325 [Aquatica leii]
MNLQAVNACSNLNSTPVYFKTKLSCHNFTILNILTQDATRYWFTELTADLKVSKFFSCIIDYLERKCLNMLGVIIICSDGCTSQNRSSVLVHVLLIFSIKHNLKIIQKFLEKNTRKWI